MLHVNYLLRTDNAKKKLTPIEHGIWHCERCNQQVYEGEYKYIFQFNMEDDTDKFNVIAFHDVAKQIIDVPALQLYEYGYEGKIEETTNIFAKLFFNTYLFKLAVHEEEFSNEKQIKNFVIACDKMDCIKNLE